MYVSAAHRHQMKVRDPLEESYGLLGATTRVLEQSGSDSSPHFPGPLILQCICNLTPDQTVAPHLLDLLFLQLYGLPSSQGSDLTLCFCLAQPGGLDATQSWKLWLGRRKTPVRPSHFLRCLICVSIGAAEAVSRP